MADRSDMDDSSSSSCFTRDSNYVLEENELIRHLPKIDEEEDSKSELNPSRPHSRQLGMGKVVQVNLAATV